jgi:hypothetical protein
MRSQQKPRFLLAVDGASAPRELFRAIERGKLIDSPDPPEDF